MWAGYVKNEQLKYWYNRWIVITTCALCLFIPTLVATLDNLTNAQGADFAKTQLLQGFYLGQTGFVVIAVLYFGQEFSKSTLRTSMLSTPKKSVFLISKGLCLIGWTIFFLLVTTMLSLLVLRLNFGIDLSFTLLRETVCALIPAYISTIQLCAIAASLVLISKSIIFPLAFILSMILGLGQLLLQFGSIFRFLPVISAMDSFLLSQSNYYMPLWSGLLCQGVWCAALIIIASILFKMRSVG